MVLCGAVIASVLRSASVRTKRCRSTESSLRAVAALTWFSGTKQVSSPDGMSILARSARMRSSSTLGAVIASASDVSPTRT